MKRVLIFTLVTGILLLNSCDTSTEMEVHGLWIRPAAQGDNGAVYMIVHNHAAVDELVGVSSDAAEAAEIHESTMDTNGVMQMTQRSSIPFAAGEEVEFKPGGLHIMLVGLKRDLNVGDEIRLTLHFKNRADIVLTVPVMDAADIDGDGMDGHDMP